MEFFINELSLHGQLHDDDCVQRSIRKLIELVSAIRESVGSGTFLKSQTLILSSLHNNAPFVSTIEHTPKELRLLLKRIVYDSSLIKDWERERLHNSTINFECDTTNGSVTDTSVAEAAERKIIDENERYLLNIDPSIFSCISSTTVSKITNETVQIEQPCLCKPNDLKYHFNLERIYPDDFLRDNLNFSPTTYTVQGRRLFIEKATNYYWYLDNFHRNHFEIFNRDKRHLGEADLDGNLIPDSADPEKHGKLPV